jgi:biofilm PGA synthesis N-glycosyltransferase PgaC
MDTLDDLTWLAAHFLFAYPFVLSWYWMAGSLIFYFVRERGQPLYTEPPILGHQPLVSILLPCFNESAQVRETVAALARTHYPNFEIVAIDDGSSDDTAEQLQQLLDEYSCLRVVLLDSNQGKSTALNAGLAVSQAEIVVCVDGDALLDPNAVTWFVNAFQSDATLGGLTGNPQIRNRSSLLGRLQVGEFSSIVGMIKRTQSVWGSILTVSGVICAFRKQAVLDTGGWNPTALTDDMDLTLRVQATGWRVTYEPNAICWILMPEKLGGLWRQRLRWSEGGIAAVVSAIPLAVTARRWPLLAVLVNYLVSLLWASLIVLFGTFWILDLMVDFENIDFNPLPTWWGTVLAVTYIVQSFIGILLDSRYEKRRLRFIFWIIWYPLMFWLLQTCAAVTGLLRYSLKPKSNKGSWVSPDRGLT